MRVQIAREGGILGEFEEESIPDGLKSGRLKKSDHYFGQGMMEWRMLADFLGQQTSEPSKPSMPPPPPKGTTMQPSLQPSRSPFPIGVRALDESVSRFNTNTPTIESPGQSDSFQGNRLLARASENDLSKIRGWLWIFCIYVAVLYPISALAEYAYNFWKIWPHFGIRLEGFWSEILLLPFQPAVAIIAISVGCSLYSGLRKVEVQKRLGEAIQRAKSFLWIAYVMSMAELIILTIDPIDYRPHRFFSQEAGKFVDSTPITLTSILAFVITATIYSANLAIWWAYWDRSKRVKAVYGNKSKSVK